jgi:putative ABC transport system ATP-binding protein
MLRVTNLKKIFSSGDTKVVATNDISLTIEEGQFISIVGQSGSGKSTLLSMLGALEKPTEGKIEIDGQDITKLRSHALTRHRSKKIGFIFQGFNLIPNLTALENVMLPMEPTDRPKKMRMQQARELLDQVGITGAKQRRKPGKLSGGEQQRVAIARALANRPKLILADEPTGNLDSKTSKMIFELLRGLSQSQGVTIIIVTHDLALARQTERVFRLQDGKLTEQ